jgi:polyphosphate kinase 2 (PPK2 family)
LRIRPGVAAQAAAPRLSLAHHKHAPARGASAVHEFERLLAACGTRVVKIFLHIGMDEQRVRQEERLNGRRKT